MEDQGHILVVDDDHDIRTLLGDYLRRNGFRATTVADGRGLWQAVDAGRIDLVILDVMLPGEDGFTLCKQLAVRTAVPVIMLTAKGDDTDRIVGLEIGADDYLPKPFNPRELLARIKSVLRRVRAVPPAMKAEAARALRFGGWTLDLEARNLVSPAQVVVALSGAEFRLLRVFLAYPNRVLSRDQLMDLPVGREADPLDRSIDVQVSRLRQRLDDGEALRPVDVDALLSAMVADEEASGHDMRLSGSAGAPFMGKPAGLRRLLQNLIDNAIKYGSDVEVAVGGASDQLAITVLDRGPGIPADALEQVFEPFRRLEASRHPDTGGPGLGLSIARNIAQAMGGDVTLSNRVGGGLEARLRLPRR